MSDFVTMTDLKSALVEIKLLRSEVQLLREEKQEDKRSIQILRMAMVNNAIRVETLEKWSEGVYLFSISL